MSDNRAPIERALKLAREIAMRSSELSRRNYTPYPKQKEFHDSLEREGLLMASNQCIGPWTFIETPEGALPAAAVFSSSGGDVLALDGERERVARWQNAILKGIEPAYRVFLDNGQAFDCSRRHRILTSSGWVSLGGLVSSAYGSRGVVTACAETARLVFSSDDAAARIPEYIRGCLALGYHSIAVYSRPHILDLFENFSGPRDLPKMSVSLSSTVSPGLGIEALHHDDGRMEIFFPVDMPKLVGGASVSAVMPIGYQPILDVEVPGLHNYKAAGCYHHNSGKSVAAAFETAAHLTGDYPAWWNGRRFTLPIVSWVAGESGETTRDTPQRLLFGRDGNGGMVAKSEIIGKPIMSRGVSQLYDYVRVRHVSGGESLVYFKSYGKGREKWQSETIEFLWLDEEPDEEVYSEGLTRTQKKGGIVRMTFTPLHGSTGLVLRFLNEPGPDRKIVTMTIHDALHYTPEQRAKIIASYPRHERDARAYGTPMLGSGAVFETPQEDIIVEPFQIPVEWPRIVGMDFGWGDHPTAAIWLAHDRDSDKVYVTDEYRSKETGIDRHASAIGRRMRGIPVAWPHDGLMKDKSSGIQIAEMYRNEGLNMNPEHAQFENDVGAGSKLEAGVTQLSLRFATGRLLIFRNCGAIMEEYRGYHRKDGVIVPLRDDCLSAARYAIMDLRYAIKLSEVETWQRKIKYPTMGIA